MDAKLTLKLDKAVIEGAKHYAVSQKRSLSRLIETYLKSLVTTQSTEDFDEIQISSFVMSLSSDFNIPSDLDFKSEYSDFLTEKYK